MKNRNKNGRFVKGHKDEFGLKISKSLKKLYKEGKLKIPSRKGAKMSQEAIEKIRLANSGKNHYNYGKKVPRKAVEEMISTLKERYRKGELFPPVKKGQTWEEVYGTDRARQMKKSLSDRKKGRKPYNKGKLCPEISQGRINMKKQRGYINSPETKEKIRKARLKQKFPLKDSSIEVALQEELRSRSVKFETHKGIYEKGFATQPDIFIEPNICIYADGCYWHGCEQCYDRNKVSDWIKARKVSDIMITKTLEKLGYKVLRFWEHEINKDVEGCVDKIERAIKKQEAVV